MKDMAVVLLSLALLTSGALAQTRPAASAPAPAGSSEAVIGTVTGSNVYVRSGPSGTAYPCAKLHSPTAVTIVKTGAWLEILPTAGTFSVIKKEFVAKDGDTGTVNADAVWTRPGGDLRTKDFWDIQVKLNKGDKVKVLGDLGDYYKIEPPPGAHFYISADYVTVDGKKPVSGNTVIAGGPTTRSTNSDGLASRTGSGSDDGVVRVVRQTTTQTVTRVPANYGKELDALDALEKELNAEWAKPLDQRDIKGLLDKYKALEIADSELKAVQDGRVKFLQSILDRRSASITAEKIVEEALKRKADDDRKLAAIKVTITQEVNGPLHYTAQGVLGASNLFTGNAVGPKRYVLRDPVVMNITAYIQCTSGAVVLEDYVGKHVGVMGKPQYDKTMMLNVVEVEKVVPQQSNAQIPESPKPGIKDSTTPAAPAVPATLPIPAIIEVKEVPAAPATAPAAPVARGAELDVRPPNHAVAPAVEAKPSPAPVTIEAGASAGIIKSAPVPDKATGSPEEMDLSEVEAANRYVAEHSTTAPAKATTKPVIEESR